MCKNREKEMNKLKEIILNDTTSDGSRDSSNPSNDATNTNTNANIFPAISMALVQLLSCP